jgi:hypothetical protein
VLGEPGTRCCPEPEGRSPVMEKRSPDSPGSGSPESPELWRCPFCSSSAFPKQLPDADPSSDRILFPSSTLQRATLAKVQLVIVYEAGGYLCFLRHLAGAPRSGGLEHTLRYGLPRAVCRIPPCFLAKQLPQDLNDLRKGWPLPCFLQPNEIWCQCVPKFREEYTILGCTCHGFHAINTWLWFHEFNWKP